MQRSKILVRTLFVFILLLGLSASIFLSSLSSVRAAPLLAAILTSTHTPQPTHTPRPTHTPVPSRTPTSTPTATKTRTATPTLNVTPCSSSTTYSSLSLVINEVGWTGTKANSTDQWVELYNPGNCEINLNNWQLIGVNYYYTDG